MGCCGGKGRPTPRRAGVTTERAVPVAEAGLVMVRYVGASVGTQNWRGPSGRVYVFGLSEPLQNCCRLTLTF